MISRLFAFGSVSAGLLALVWLVFFLAQELFAMPVHIPRSIATWIGIPLTLVLPCAAVALGVAAILRLRAQGVARIGSEQIAATSGVILGGVVLLLCLLVYLWMISLPR